MDQTHSNTSQSRIADRKTVEKNRRIRMKALYSELNSLLPQSSRETLPLPDQLDEAAKYIKKLQVNVEKKKERKRKLFAATKLHSTGSSSVFSTADVFEPRRLPTIEIQETGSILHIFLVTSLEHKFMVYEIIRLLNEQFGAEITQAGYSVVGDAVFHTLHCKVEECDNGARSRISESLKKLMNSEN